MRTGEAIRHLLAVDRAMTALVNDPIIAAALDQADNGWTDSKGHILALDEMPKLLATVLDEENLDRVAREMRAAEAEATREARRAA